VTEGVKVEGLKELQRSLKKYGNDAPKEMRTELKVAGERVVNDARRRLQESIGKNLIRDSRSTGRAVGSLRVLSNAKGVFIVGGKAKVPYYGWLDFGGVLKPEGKRRNTQRKRVHKDSGRAIYPAINANMEHLRASADTAMGNARRKAGL
jgi:hypothetical protein